MKSLQRGCFFLHDKDGYRYNYSHSKGLKGSSPRLSWSFPGSHSKVSCPLNLELCYHRTPSRLLYTLVFLHSLSLSTLLCCYCLGSLGIIESPPLAVGRVNYYHVHGLACVFLLFFCHLSIISDSVFPWEFGNDLRAQPTPTPFDQTPTGCSTVHSREVVPGFGEALDTARR